eukprot:GHVL01043880.1.p1 GENE.GHVL01043880.1~~GHVL01043880.1.p1  ORF type:complete len:629 (+),score=135.76 GHVL01043880.1:178-1887(+)
MKSSKLLSPTNKDSNPYLLETSIGINAWNTRSFRRGDSTELCGLGVEDHLKCFGSRVMRLAANNRVHADVKIQHLIASSFLSISSERKALAQHLGFESWMHLMFKDSTVSSPENIETQHQNVWKILAEDYEKNINKIRALKLPIDIKPIAKLSKNKVPFLGAGPVLDIDGIDFPYVLSRIRDEECSSMPNILKPTKNIMSDLIAEKCFSTDKTVMKMMEIVGDLWGVQINPIKLDNSITNIFKANWHKKVICFEVIDEKLVGHMHVDLNGEQLRNGFEKFNPCCFPITKSDVYLSLGYLSNLEQLAPSWMGIGRYWWANSVGRKIVVEKQGWRNAQFKISFWLKSISDALFHLTGPFEESWERASDTRSAVRSIISILAFNPNFMKEIGFYKKTSMEDYSNKLEMGFLGEIPQFSFLTHAALELKMFSNLLDIEKMKPTDLVTAMRDEFQAFCPYTLAKLFAPFILPTIRNMVGHGDCVNRDFIGSLVAINALSKHDGGDGSYKKNRGDGSYKKNGGDGSYKKNGDSSYKNLARNAIFDIIQNNNPRGGILKLETDNLDAIRSLVDMKN